MAYRAEIQIGVVGVGQLGALQKSLNQVATTVDIINKKRVDAGFNVQNINTYNAALQKAWQNINKAAMGSQEELQAVKDLVVAKNNQIAAQQRLNKLIAQEEATQRRIVATADAGFGMQGPKPAPRPSGGAAPAGLGFRAQPGGENLALGAGFPLLFGGGAGQVAGGLLGSFFGQGFGGQILGSAIGQQLEDAIRRISDIGKATKELNMDTLRDSVIAVNAGLDITVERLIKAGQADAARAEIGKQIALQTGLLPEATEGTAAAVSALSTAWNEVVGAVSGLLSLLGRPFVSALAVILQGIAKAAQGMNILIQLMNKYIPGIAIANRLWTEIEKRLPKIAEDQEQLKAEIERQSDAYSRQLGLSMKLEDIDKRRNKGNNIAAQINNNELDRQTRITKLRDDTEKKIQAERLKFKGQDITLLESQIRAEAAIEERTINREAARKRETLEIQKALEVLNNIKAIEDSRAALQEQLNTNEQNRLQQQQYFAQSLNEESAIIDRIAQSKQQSAAQDLQATYNKATLAVQQAELEGKSVAATKEIAANNIAAAEAKYRDLQATIDLERREQQVAAYAKELAIETQKAARAAEEHLAKLDNSTRRITSFADAYTTINNIQKGILQTELESTTNIDRKKQILTQIYEIDIANAKLALESAKAQIAADIERQRILLGNARLKFEELRATTLYAEAQGVVKREHYAALDAAASALRIADDTYKTTQQVATYQLQAAQAVYNGAIQGAKAAYEAGVLKVNTAAAAGAAQEFAGAMAQGAAATAAAAGAARTLEQMSASIGSFRGEYTTTSSYTAEEAKALGIGPYASKTNPGAVGVRLASGGFITGSTNAVVGEGGPEYVIPAAKMDEAMSRYAQGQRGSSVIPSSINPQVNVTTGPVMNMNGSNYVSQQDFMAGMQTASRRGAEMALEALQNNGSMRRMAGVG